jgi:hypothetical protein
VVVVSGGASVVVVKMGRGMKIVVVVHGGR